jgi:Tol biopolymer transport system component
LRSSRQNLERTGVFVGSLDKTPEEQDQRPLLMTATSPVFARGTRGDADRILFLREGNLMAQVFDVQRLELLGTPAPVAERVHSFLDTTTASASDNGVLVYKTASETSQLTWLDRQGRVVARLSEPGLYAGVSLSRDGSRAAVLRTNPQVTSSLALWLIDVATDRSTRFAATAGAQAAVWSPDGRRIVFVSNTSGFETLLMQKPTDGSGPEELLLRLDDRSAPASWSADGRTLLYIVVDPKTNSDLWAFPLDGASKPVPFLRSEAAESQAQFSPDQKGARVVAFTSNESGHDEVHLTTFPDARNRIVVSNAGGHSPRWRADGKELFYVAADGTVMSAAILDNPLRVGTMTPLFRVPPGFGRPDATGRRGPAAWDVAPDGQRFLIAAPLEGDAGSQFTVVLNWQQGLAEK